MIDTLRSTIPQPRGEFLSAMNSNKRVDVERHNQNEWNECCKINNLDKHMRGLKMDVESLIWP